jgi:hypothetical protein
MGQGAQEKVLAAGAGKVVGGSEGRAAGEGAGEHGRGNGGADEHRQDVVEILVNNKPRGIHRGRQSVQEIKAAGGVALADELEQVIDGKLTPLADDASVVIKGGERFVSHPRDSGSSHEEGRA